MTLLLASIPPFVHLLLNHRPASLRGESIHEAMRVEGRQPAHLRELYRAHGRSFRRLRALPPSLAFAVLGQARADDGLSPELEGRMLADLLTFWALRSTLDSSRISAAARRERRALNPAL
jgi:hypothetical protein